MRPDDAAWLRSIFRWYSKTFHTPLADVESLPKEHILQHYFEATFEEMEEGDLKAELEFTLETPEERKAKAEAEEAEEDEFMKMLEEEAKKDKEKGLKGKIQAPKLESLKRPEPEEAPLEPDEPISVSFSDNDASMEELLEGDFIPTKK